MGMITGWEWAWGYVRGMRVHGAESVRVDDRPGVSAAAGWGQTVVVLIAGLLLVVVAPQVYAMHWTPKAALGLVLIGPGLVALLGGVRVRDRASIAAVAFLAIAALATIISPTPLTSLVGLFNHGTGLLFVAAVVGMWALGRRLSAMVAARLELVLIGAATINAVVMWIQNSRAFDGDVFTLVDGRPPGLLGNPVHAAALLLGAFALVLERWRAATRVVPATGDRRARAAAAIGLGALFASALELSGGRIGLGLLMIVAVVGGVRLGWRQGAVLLVSVGLALGGASLAVDDGSGAAARVAASGNSALAGRIDRWRMAEPAVRARPLLGIGPGLYRRGTSRFATPASARAFGADSVNIDAHNVVVEYAVTTGILGVIALLGWLFLAARGARGGLVWFATVGAFSLLLQPQFIGLTPVLALALGAAKRDAAVPPPPWSKLAVSGAIALAVIGAVFGALLLHADGLQRSAAFNDRPVDGRNAVRALPIWPAPDLTLARQYARLATVDHQRGAWQHAIVAYRAAKRRDPSDPDVLNRLGEVEFAHGSLERARAAYEAARFWNPQSVDARLGLARIEARAGNQHASDRWCQAVKVLAPRLHCPIRD